MAVHAVEVTGGLLPQSAWQRDHDRKTVFCHHGRIYLGWEACLKRIRARLQTRDLVGVALR